MNNSIKRVKFSLITFLLIQGTFCFAALNHEWRFEANSEIFATPAIDGNGSLYFGSQDGTFFAIDGRSGLLKWKKETDYNFLFGSAAVTNSGLVIIGGVNAGLGGVIAFSKDGKVAWEHQTSGIFTNIAVDNRNQVYVAARNKELICLDGDKGTLVWNFIPSGWILDNSPIIDNKGNVIICSYPDHSSVHPRTPAQVYSLNPEDGSLNWTWSAPSFGSFIQEISNPISSFDGKIFVVGNFGQLFIIDANSGKLDSYELLNETIFASPSLHKDVLYLSTWDGEVIAFDYRKKEVKWKEKISSSPLGSTPAISQNNKIYLGSFFWSSYGSYKIDDSKVIYEVDSNTGNLDWSYDLDTSLVLNSTGYIYDVASSPIITDNGHIYITYEHSVHKFVGASSPPIDASWPMNNRNSQQTSQMPLIQDGWKFLNGDSWMYSANSKSWQYLHASSEHLHMLDIANNHWSTILDGEEIIGSRYIDGYNQAVQDIVSKPDQFQLYDSEDLEKANENSWSNGYNDGLKFEDFAPISLNNRTVIFQYDSGLVSRVRFYSDGLNGAYNNINSSGNILYLYSPTSSKEASITINTPSEIIQGNVTFKNPNRGTFAGTIKIIATGSISNLSAVFKFL